MVDQGPAKKTQEDKSIVCKSDGYTGKPNPKLGGTAGGDGRKKETARNWTNGQRKMEQEEMGTADDWEGWRMAVQAWFEREAPSMAGRLEVV